MNHIEVQKHNQVMQAQIKYEPCHRRGESGSDVQVEVKYEPCYRRGESGSDVQVENKV